VKPGKPQFSLQVLRGQISVWPSDDGLKVMALRGVD
jgi:hypothetical protein